MSLRIRSAHRWLWAAAVVGLSAGPAAAELPSPLELVRGLRENGQFGLALEYLKEVEGKPLSADDKAAVQLERAKCLLDASEEETDEGTRQGMIAEAKEMLHTFVTDHPRHPRAVEGLLTTAKLTSLDAKEQLGRARKMDVPPPSTEADERAAREAAQQAQKKEAAGARPLFQLASKRFADASGLLRKRLDDKALDPFARRKLEREVYEADLAAAVNQFNLADTYYPEQALGLPEKKQRNTFLEQAKKAFEALADGPANSRTVWVARAWIAEIIYQQTDFAAADAAVERILRANVAAAADGKRLAYFFQVRHHVQEALGDGSAKKITASVTEMGNWLRRFGNARKPTPEEFTLRYYLARVLHYQADLATPAPKPPAVLKVDGTARRQLVEAERLYRGLAQTENEYTSRAHRYRMAAVRKLLGEAAQPAASYTSFENAQMAALIHMGNVAAAVAKAEKLVAADAPDQKKIDAARAEAAAARGRVIALLERARELAGPQDSPADVADVFLRLIYFYREDRQPYRAAVLGEYVAHTLKTGGGKAAMAGMLGLYGYLAAGERVRADDPEAAQAARRADRDRAVALARFLDEKYPNDNATDAVRLQLAALLTGEKQLMPAYEMVIKIRPGFAGLTKARLLEAYLVRELTFPADAPLPEGDKARLYRRATGDLAKVPKPPAIAAEDEARDYLKARCQLAAMMLGQFRADPATEKRDAGFNQALNLSTAILAEVPTFDSMAADPKAPAAGRKLNLDGQEMHLTALDVHTRALYLRARAMIDNNQLDGALALVQPTLDLVQKGGALFTPEMKAWASGRGGTEPDADQKANIGQLAEGADRKRVDVILAAFRVRVEQAKAAEAGALLDLMVKAGGSIEANLPLLEPVGRELAAKLTILRRAGKEDEAKKMAAGLTVLLEKMRAVPNLKPSLILFLAQTLQAVGENDKALELLKKVPAPEVAGWETLTADKMPADKPELPSQIRNYERGQLVTAMALRGAKKYAEAEALLKGIVGDAGKPGWGSGKMYFRKELAELYEARAADTPNPKDANLQWRYAVQEWSTMFGMQRNRLAKMPEGAAPAAVAAARNDYADAFFDVYRSTMEGNRQVLQGAKGGAEKVQKLYDDVGKKFADIERQIPAGQWNPEVQNRYADLLQQNPPVMAAYKAAGGKAFLEKLPPRQQQ